MAEITRNISEYQYEQGLLHKLYFRQSLNIFRKLVHQNANYYLKPTDIISHRPTLFGYHEPHLEGLFELVSKTHNDFLLDIGANVGLSSVICGSNFTEIHCVEPNKTLSKILGVNLEISGLSYKSKIHNVGLGKETTVEELWIPRNNFGGAFIPRGNAYDGNNDTVQRLAREEHIVQEIRVVESNIWFSDLFASHGHWANGLVKIDVEGFEMPIFQSILRTLPKHVSLVVIMENFLNSFDFDQFKTPHHEIEWFGFYKKKSVFKSIPFKLLGMSSYFVQKLQSIDTKASAPHDIVVLITPKKQ